MLSPDAASYGHPQTGMSDWLAHRLLEHHLCALCLQCAPVLLSSSSGRDAAPDGQHQGLVHTPAARTISICSTAASVRSPGRELPATTCNWCCAVQASTAEGFTDPAGLCSTYLDTFGSDVGSTFARFLAVVNFLTANGFYVVIDYQYQQASSTTSLVPASRYFVVA